MTWLGWALLVPGAVLLVVAAGREITRRRRMRAFFAWEPLPSAPTDWWRSLNRRLHPDRRALTILVVGGALALIVLVVMDSVLLAVLLVGGSIGAVVMSRSRAERRTRLLLRSQMADGMSSIASSMTAGSSFLEGLQELTRDSKPPLRAELEQALDEIEIGVSAADAFHALAARTDLAPARWLSHLLRLQETSGSPLAPMLQRLANLVHRDDELAREVQALTAEGRMSAWVIAALPIGMIVFLELSQPTYLDSFLSGGWLLVGVGLVASIVVGLVVINRMVTSLEV